jgi:DNA polymerase-3 subunit delta'
LLLTGPSGVGKRHLALQIAKRLVCAEGDPPCGRCVQCRQLEGGSHPDVLVVERPEGKDAIAIAQVREMRDWGSLLPFQAERKVCIIADAEGLTLQAADALLKTLEEPQRSLTIILTAAEADALPATVISRCRVIHLAAIETDRIAAALKERGTDAAGAERLARLSRGSIGWALTAATMPKLATQREDLLDRLSGVLDMDLGARLDLAESLAADRKDRSAIRNALEILLLLARDLVLVMHGVPPQLVSPEGSERLERQAQRYGLADVEAYLGRIRLTMDRIDANVDPRLALEALLVNIP